MELISLPKTIKKCCKCKKNGYYAETKNAGDDYFCPICNSIITEDEMRIRNTMYCSKCCIPYQFGCTHGENGCTYDTYHAMFIKKFTFDGVVYEGIPKFETYADYLSQIKKLNCEWYCTCNGNAYDCLKAVYVRDIEKCKYWGKINKI